MEDFSIKLIVEDMEKKDKYIERIVKLLTYLCFAVILLSFNTSWERKVESRDQQIEMYKKRWETRDKAADYYKMKYEVEKAKNDNKVSH